MKVFSSQGFTEKKKLSAYAYLNEIANPLLMVKIAYLLLCHKNPASVIAQAQALTAAGDVVAIHFDLRGANSDFTAIRDAFAEDQAVTLAKRVACGWGEYSLVQATFNMIHAARSAFNGVTHYMMISGDCFPIKSRRYIAAQLENNDRDFIEMHDFMQSDWIKTGMKEDRLRYRHWFNERTQKSAFYATLNLQRRFGLTRKIPDRLTVRIGSQWWLLRASTIEKVLAFLKRRREVGRFFKTTWIPDEIEFQTIVPHVIPHEEIEANPPTTLIFSDYGIPVVFFRDHLEMLMREPRFFARKVTETDQSLRDEMLDHYCSDVMDEPSTEQIAPYYRYISERGRHGRRAAARFWQRSTVLDDSKEVLVIACKKWHIGQHFAKAVTRITGIDSIGYVFDQDQPLDMDLGNLEVGKDKRGRHRRAFLSLLFETRNVAKLALCADPSRDDVVSDFADTDCRMRVMLIDTDFSDRELLDHGERVGLLNAEAGEAQRDAVITALKVEFAEESGRLRKSHRGRLDRVSADQNRVENAAAIARFLRVGRDEVEAVVRELETRL